MGFWLSLNFLRDLLEDKKNGFRFMYTKLGMSRRNYFFAQCLIHQFRSFAMNSLFFCFLMIGNK